MENTKKKTIVPNECSLLRWVGTAVLALVLGTLFVTVYQIAVLMLEPPQTLFGIQRAELDNMVLFVLLFAATVLSLRLAAKTSLRAFIFGAGEGPDIKDHVKRCLPVTGAYLVGLALTFVPFLPNIRPRGVEPVNFAVLVLFMLAVAWMQTTTEELLFRGLFIRAACKNDIGMTKKAVVFGLISALLFAAAHLSNPEVTSQSGVQALLTGLSYTLPGMGLYLLDLRYKSLLPGILIHWVNNFIAFTLISSEVSAVSVPTLLVDTTPQTGTIMFLCTLVPYVFALAYAAVSGRKRGSGGR